MESRNLKGTVELKKLISYKWLRTVADPSCEGSPNEYLIYIDIKDPFRKSLSFKTPYHGHLYAYAFLTTPLKELLDSYGFTLSKVRVDLADWDDQFVISFEENAKEAQFFCSKDDVKFLLEKCIRIPEQRLINK